MRISAVVPTYNRKAELLRTIGQLDAQDFPAGEYEIVVVSDGSTDGTAEAVRALRTRCDLRLLESPNRGPAAARNQGIRAARGELVLMLDDDLEFSAALLSQHAAAHTGHPRRFAFGPVLLPDSDAPTPAQVWMAEWAVSYYGGFQPGEQPPERADEFIFPNSSAPRSLWLEAGGYEASLGLMADLELGLRLGELGVERYFLPEAVAYHRYEKSAERIAELARIYGEREVMIARRHPKWRARAAAGRLGSAPAWKRALLEASMRSPRLSAGLLRLAYGAAESVGARAAAVKVLRLRDLQARLVGSAAYAGGRAALEAEFAARIPVLAYHRVAPAMRGEPPWMNVTPEEFARHLAWLAGEGYRGTTPSQWLRWLRTGTGLPPKPVLLTFDDAYAATAEHALPLLRRHDFGAAVFVVTGYVGGTSQWMRAGRCDHPLMTADDIRRWAQEGVEFGSHSRSHPDLRACSPAQLEDEVGGSRAALEALAGRAVVAFAYPFGEYSEAVVAAVRRHYALGFCSLPGVNALATDAHLLRRVEVPAGTSLAELSLIVRLGWNPLERARLRWERARRERSLAPLVWSPRGWRQ